MKYYQISYCLNLFKKQDFQAAINHLSKIEIKSKKLAPMQL